VFDVTNMTQSFAIISASVHVLFFALESVLFPNPRVHRIFGVRTKEQYQEVWIWAFNQGWYNLFLALGGFYGVYLGGEVGKTLIRFVNLAMVGAGVVLISSNTKMLRGFLLQAVPAAIALIATAF